MPNVPAYARYGAVGITVCDRWRSFDNFIADVGERPSLAMSLDRWPNKSGNYEPGNVRWATGSQQCRNKKNTRAVVRSDGLWFPSIIDAAEATNADNRAIRSICEGEQKAHRGFSWRYAT
jgi:hypothetical protein